MIGCLRDYMNVPEMSHKCTFKILSLSLMIFGIILNRSNAKFEGKAPCHEGIQGGREACLHSLLTWALNGGERSFLRNHRSAPAERASDVHSIGKWVDLRASLDASKKENMLLRPRIKSDPSFAYISEITGR